MSNWTIDGYKYNQDRSFGTFEPTTEEHFLKVQLYYSIFTKDKSLENKTRRTLKRRGYD